MSRELSSMPAVIARWHELVEARDNSALDELLAEDVIFESPIVHTPQVGKATTKMYLGAATVVLNNEHFRYPNEWYGPNSAVLEFTTLVDGISINGIDMITWNASDQIIHFKVMVRPLKAVNLLHAMMGAQLAK